MITKEQYDLLIAFIEERNKQEHRVLSKSFQDEHIIDDHLDGVFTGASVVLSSISYILGLKLEWFKNDDIYNKITIEQLRKNNNE